jgi:lysophospholipase L1-like esterase
VAIGTAWLVAGATALLLLGVEFTYRLVAPSDAQRLSDPVAEPLHPLRGQRWFSDYQLEFAASKRLRWEPHVYWRREPFRGRFITVDSVGRRTWRGALLPGASRQVWVLGGSTAWGTYQRDSLTLPSVIAESLHARGFRDVAVENLGETGYVSMQEVLYLALRLRAGSRPDVVVFYDGLNDVAAAVIAGRAGLPQNESNRAADFRLGRILQAQDDGPALFALGRAFLARSRLAGWLLTLRSRPGRLGPSGDALAEDVTDTYARTVQIVEALALGYGFRAIYCWQPSLHVTRKRLSPFERAIVSTMVGDRGYQQRQAVHEHLEARLFTAVPSVARERFVDLTRVFDAESATVFLDQIGHTTEAANALVVAALLPKILWALGSREADVSNRLH